MRSTLKGLTEPQLNVRGAFTGKSTDEIVYMWNQDNPNDMINSATEPRQTPPA